ncbi:hypothetical protein IFM89_032655 [Coptis chinensis]|uniref:Uncharacterized protein n=1 Tax=Coptis chinensis TaxID=261450 RepID=A0A835IDA5_9MAGN|nr:hypothetical protein IFM89_032655 [Coptis chinensis]
MSVKNSVFLLTLPIKKVLFSPSALTVVRDWFRDYKIPDGMPANKFGLGNKAANKGINLLEGKARSRPKYLLPNQMIMLTSSSSSRCGAGTARQGSYTNNTAGSTELEYNGSAPSLEPTVAATPNMEVPGVRTWSSLFLQNRAAARTSNLKQFTLQEVNGVTTGPTDLIMKGCTEWSEYVVGFFIEQRLSFTYVKNVVGANRAQEGGQIERISTNTNVSYENTGRNTVIYAGPSCIRNDRGEETREHNSCPPAQDEPTEIPTDGGQSELTEDRTQMTEVNIEMHDSMQMVVHEP